MTLPTPPGAPYRGHSILEAGTALERAPNPSPLNIAPLAFVFLAPRPALALIGAVSGPRGKAMNGTYGFVFSGPTGVGIGVFRITDTKLVGTDLVGVRYRGEAIEDAGGITLSVDMTVPQGVFLVQGVAPQDLPYTRSFSTRTPPDFGDGKPFDVYIPPSNVTLMVRRISDDWASHADGVSVDIKPINR
jgi:hypothetical protein